MKPVQRSPNPSHQDAPKHPKPLGGEQQALAEKATGSSASVKARIESQHMPDKPPLAHQNMPNSSGRK